MFFLSIYLVPLCSAEIRERITEIRSSSINASILKEKRFITPDDNLTFFFKEIKGKDIYGLLIHDRSEKNNVKTYVAKKGYLENKNNNNLILLYDGTMQIYDDKQGKKYKTDEIALESLMQSLTIDDKLVKKSTKLPFFNSDVIGRMEDGAYVHDLDSIINRLTGNKYGSVKSKNYFINKNGKKELFKGAAPDLFSLPIYYNSSSGQYQSARELAETITETPFYKQNKLSKPSLVNSIISLENSIVNPTFEVVRDKLQGIQESYNSLAELKQEVIDRHRENYRLHGYDEDFVDSLTDYRLDLNKLELTEINFRSTRWCRLLGL